MDQSFNDQELSDIMKEIEALEQNFASPTPDPSHDMEQQSDVFPHEDVNAVAKEVVEDSHLTDHEVEMSEEIVNEPTLGPQVTATPNIISINPGPSTPQSMRPNSSMSFKVEGPMTLDMKFDFGGKVVYLEINEAGFQIEMDGGMKFTLPLTQSGNGKKSA